MKAYYFSGADKKLRFGDNRQIRVGRTHKVKFPFTDEEGQTWDKPTLCNAGLHASINIVDALGYAPGSYLWEVELNGEIIQGSDKCVAVERKYIRGFNATDLLRDFARQQAQINIEKIQPYTDQYELIAEYLQTGNESIKAAAWSAAEAAWSAAAGSAAWSAAGSAAWSAAWSARSAAWSAAEAAAGSAARSAARSAWSAWSAAAGSAARSAAEAAEAAWSAAAWSAAAGSAARSAAWSAAAGAAWSAAETMLQTMVDEHFSTIGGLRK